MTLPPSFTDLRPGRRPIRCQAIEPALRNETGQDHDDPAHDLLRDIAALSGIEGDARFNPVMKERA